MIDIKERKLCALDQQTDARRETQYLPGQLRPD